MFFSLMLTVSFGLPAIRQTVAVILCGGFGLLILGSIPLILNCILHLAFVGWQKFQPRPASPKLAVRVSLACCVVTIGFVLATGMRPYRELLEVRKQLPLQNQADRLAYERQSSTSNMPLEATRPPSRLSDSWMDFELTLITDMGIWPQARHRYLRQVHDRNVESFIKSQGFGVSRMMLMFPNPRDGILPKLTDIPFQPTNRRTDAFDRGKYWIPPQWQTGDPPSKFHFAGLLDFLNTTSFGLKIEPQVTIGFEPHAFHFSAQPVSYQTAMFDLADLKLISLRRFAEPRAYVLDHLPRMDQLLGDDAPTRALNEFENRSLNSISQNNEDVVIEYMQPTLLMLGSIRAVQSCLDCHSAARGELLGVFSYRFEPTQEATQK